LSFEKWVLASAKLSGGGNTFFFVASQRKGKLFVLHCKNAVAIRVSSGYNRKMTLVIAECSIEHVAFKRVVSVWVAFLRNFLGKPTNNSIIILLLLAVVCIAYCYCGNNILK
jgi:hypothetical protein